MFILEYDTRSAICLQPATVPQVAYNEKEPNAELKTHVTVCAMADKYDITITARMLQSDGCSTRIGLTCTIVEGKQRKPPLVLLAIW